MLTPRMMMTSSTRPMTPPSSRAKVRPPSTGWRPTDLVAGAVADHRQPGTAQVGEDQLALDGGLPGRRVDHLGDELRLVDEQPGLELGLEAPRPHLGGPGVVEAPRPPGLLDPRPGGRQAGTGLAGVDGHLHTGVGQVDALLVGHLGEVQGVGGGAHQHRDVVDHHRLEPLRRRHAAAGDGQGADQLGALVAAPEPDERAEREGEEDPVDRGDPGGPVDRAPAPRPTSSTTPRCRGSATARRWCPTSGGSARTASGDR